MRLQEPSLGWTGHRGGDVDARFHRAAGESAIIILQKITLLMFDIVQADLPISDELNKEIKKDGVVIYEKA